MRQRLPTDEQCARVMKRRTADKRFGFWKRAARDLGLTDPQQKSLMHWVKRNYMSKPGGV